MIESSVSAMQESEQLTVKAAKFPRPTSGLRWKPESGFKEYVLENKPGWQCNGGTYRGHPAKGMPFSLEAVIPQREGELRRITIFGIFALYADKGLEAPGAVGATIQLLAGGEVVYRQDLLNGTHYRDAFDTTGWDVGGDGMSVTTVGTAMVDGSPARVDCLTIDVGGTASTDVFRFKDLGSPASFVFFDVFFEFEPVTGCPFRVSSGGVALSDVASIVRVGDRVRFGRAIDQLVAGMEAMEDLDEARGQALTFLALVTAGTLEMGASRQMHSVQLAAARKFDELQTIPEIIEAAKETVEIVAAPLFGVKSGPSARLVDRALTLVERNYARTLSDTAVAEQLGLSTSHFRFLFKQATGQPFHKYLVAVRLEKARKLLLDDRIPVSAVATAVGFSGLAHFSRAFSQRFQVSPTTIRRSAPAESHE